MRSVLPKFLLSLQLKLLFILDWGKLVRQHDWNTMELILQARNRAGRHGVLSKRDFPCLFKGTPKTRSNSFRYSGASLAWPCSTISRYFLEIEVAQPSFHKGILLDCRANCRAWPSCSKRSGCQPLVAMGKRKCRHLTCTPSPSWRTLRLTAIEVCMAARNTERRLSTR